MDVGGDEIYACFLKRWQIADVSIGRRQPYPIDFVERGVEAQRSRHRMGTITPAGRSYHQRRPTVRVGVLEHRFRVPTD